MNNGPVGYFNGSNVSDKQMAVVQTTTLIEDTLFSHFVCYSDHGNCVWVIDHLNWGQVVGHHSNSSYIWMSDFWIPTVLFVLFSALKSSVSYAMQTFT